MRAVDAAGDALFRERPVPGTPERERERAAAQRRADAVGLLAERALAAGLGRGADAPMSGTRAQRYQVVLHVDRATLESSPPPEDVSAETSPLPRSELEDGTRVAAETARRLCCDASVVRATHAPDGALLDVGRKTRTIPPTLRRALEIRDRGCRFPGCGLRYTDGHHVRHWADGGATSLANCLLLCHFHHTLVHEGGWSVEPRGDGRFAFVSPSGSGVFDAGWTPPALPERPVAALVRQNLARGARPDAWTAGARWAREADVPDEVYFRAREAL
jgi:hypothetical protein